MSTGSPNKAVKSGLIETLQRKVEPPKLYDALRKMDDDINKCYEALFDGPLPAVDGFNLTRLNALSLEGIVEEDNLPPNLAFQDRENFYSDPNYFLNQSLFATGDVDTSDDGVRSTDTTRFLRLGGMNDGEFFLSADLGFDSVFSLDDGAVSGFAATFIDGNVQFKKWLDDGSGPDAMDTWFFNGRELGIRNFAQDDDLSLCLIDENDVLLLGEKASTFSDLWRGHIAIPNKIDTDLPAAGTEPNGIIVIDKTNGKLCYYTNGSRYAITGTAF